MDSNITNEISINIPNYNGPLEVLLDLAKSQKVDLAEISTKSTFCVLAKSNSVSKGPL